MIGLIPENLRRIPVGQIDLERRLTDFSLGPIPSSLETSVKEIGITHPVILIPRGQGYGVVAGHRRVRLANDLRFADVPAQLVDPKTDEATALKINLIENKAHRQYSDLEKGLVVRKLHRAGIGEGEIVGQYLPLLGLERSKKLYADFLQAGALPAGLCALLHEMNVPLRAFSVLFEWDAESRDAAENLFSRLRPGANKWRDLLDLLDETARRDGVKAGDLLRREEIQSLLTSTSLTGHEKYDRIFQTAYRWRYPTLWDLKKRVLLALDRLKLDDKIKIRTPENFENGEIKIELRFATQEELISRTEQLSKASGSETMAELIKVFRELG